MLELITFAAVPVALIEMALVLAFYLKVSARQWALPSIILLVVWILLPPHWFSSLMVVLLSFAVLGSHFYVAMKTRRRGLPVAAPKRSSEEGAGDGPIMPFPAINQGPGNKANYQGVDQGETEREGYDRYGHPTKKPGTKRRKKKRKQKNGQESKVSTADLPTADKPTIEEYLKPRSDFFDD